MSKLKQAAIVAVLSLAIAVVLLWFIKFGPDLGAAAPFLVLLWLSFVALFGYACAAVAVQIIFTRRGL